MKPIIKTVNTGSIINTIQLTYYKCIYRFAQNMLFLQEVSDQILVSCYMYFPTLAFSEKKNPILNNSYNY